MKWGTQHRNGLSEREKDNVSFPREGIEPQLNAILPSYDMFQYIAFLYFTKANGKIT